MPRWVNFSTTSCSTGRPVGPLVKRIARIRKRVRRIECLLGEWFADYSPRAYVLRVEGIFGAAREDYPKAERRHPNSLIVDVTCTSANVFVEPYQSRRLTSWDVACGDPPAVL